VGRYGGGLAAVRPDDLGAVVLREVVARAGVDPAAVEDVILGCANQAGEDNRNVARMSALLAGYPVEVPGQTVNRLCGSGLQAVNSACQAVRAGEADVFVAGGVESMSRAPWVMLKPERGWPGGAGDGGHGAGLALRESGVPGPWTVAWARRRRTWRRGTGSTGTRRTGSRWRASAAGGGHGGGPVPG
jgi:acetyl-CoA acetyltransferase